MSRPSEGPIGEVTHGTAMNCLLGGGDPAERARFWSDLTMPDAWALSGVVPTRLDCLRS